jgi:hypothetical protein
MTRAHRLLADLSARGVSVHFDGAHLRLYPRSALTETLISQLLESRVEILAVLRARQLTAGVAAGADAPALPPLHWWLLCALARTPHRTRHDLYITVTAPRPVLDRALAALLHSRELRATADGRLDLNAS